MSTIPALILLDLGYNFRACGVADTLCETLSLFIATAINGVTVTIVPQEQNHVSSHYITPILIGLERVLREIQNAPLIPPEYVKRHTCHISTAVPCRLDTLAVANVKGNEGNCAGRIVTRTLHKVG